MWCPCTVSVGLICLTRDLCVAIRNRDVVIWSWDGDSQNGSVHAYIYIYILLLLSIFTVFLLYLVIYYIFLIMQDLYIYKSTKSFSAPWGHGAVHVGPPGLSGGAHVLAAHPQAGSGHREERHHEEVHLPGLAAPLLATVWLFFTIFHLFLLFFTYFCSVFDGFYWLPALNRPLTRPATRTGSASCSNSMAVCFESMLGLFRAL